MPAPLMPAHFTPPWRRLSRPIQRGPRTAAATRRCLKPGEQWIAIPVPALVDQGTWDQAQAQLARNAALSFRNNTIALAIRLRSSEIGGADRGA